MKKSEQGYQKMKNDNDKKIRDYKKQRLNKMLLIFFPLCVIILEILALFNVIDMLWGCGVFLIMIVFKKIFLK